MTEPPASDAHRVDVLFLLVGGNPLPNYVAGCLLSAPGATLYLLRSNTTTGVAKRLEAALLRARSDLTFRYLDVPEADGPAIARTVEACARQIQRETPNIAIGLNYSGGTKPMSVYSVLALRTVFPRTVLSYLHAGALSLVIDGGGALQTLPIQRAVRLQLREIVEMHGFRLAKYARAPRHLPISRAIERIHLQNGGLEAWRKWLWDSRGLRLPGAEDSPLLVPALEAFGAACEGPPTIEGVAAALGEKSFASCSKYFTGGWLEDLTLDATQQAGQRIALDDCAAGLKIRASNLNEFEIDVAATIGYQLFAISCIAAVKKEQAKEHLLEVFTRARQMGGDEARFALVCLSDNPQDLENEVAQAWDAVGKLKVFGRKELPDLPNQLFEWFRKANQEGT